MKRNYQYGNQDSVPVEMYITLTFQLFFNHYKFEICIQKVPENSSGVSEFFLLLLVDHSSLTKLESKRTSEVMADTVLKIKKLVTITVLFYFKIF